MDISQYVTQERDDVGRKIESIMNSFFIKIEEELDDINRETFKLKAYDGQKVKSAYMEWDTETTDVSSRAVVYKWKDKVVTLEEKTKLIKGEWGDKRVTVGYFIKEFLLTTPADFPEVLKIKRGLLEILKNQEDKKCREKYYNWYVLGLSYEGDHDMPQDKKTPEVVFKIGKRLKP